jgi:hypothetical protein
MFLAGYVLNLLSFPPINDRQYEVPKVGLKSARYHLPGSSFFRLERTLFSVFMWVSDCSLQCNGTGYVGMFVDKDNPSLDISM